MRFDHPARCRCGAQAPLRPEHEWWVDSPEHGNCFWTYFRHNDRAHTLSEIAELLGLSISAITAIERKAFSKFRSTSGAVAPSSR